MTGRDAIDRVSAPIRLQEATGPEQEGALGQTGMCNQDLRRTVTFLVHGVSGEPFSSPNKHGMR